jgi:hypothetical protein
MPSTLREIVSAIKPPRNDNAITSFAPPPFFFLSPVECFGLHDFCEDVFMQRPSLLRQGVFTKKRRPKRFSACYTSVNFYEETISPFF